ncbi:MAG: hypothetical protein HKP55_00380 [Gammaproteobacteria bacterium]|nr:hypothetical protein [Gammaproteobacteria bacterium]
MLKKILFTAAVIFLVLFIARWRQKKAAQVAAQSASVPQDKGSPNVVIYYLAGAVITLMAVAVVYWFILV